MSAGAIRADLDAEETARARSVRLDERYLTRSLTRQPIHNASPTSCSPSGPRPCMGNPPAEGELEVHEVD